MYYGGIYNYVLCFQRANMLNHASLNGRGKLLPKNLRMHMISWIDAPDDVYFIATSATKYVKNCLQIWLNYD